MLFECGDVAVLFVFVGLVECVVVVADVIVVVVCDCWFLCV